MFWKCLKIVINFVNTLKSLKGFILCVAEASKISQQRNRFRMLKLLSFLVQEKSECVRSYRKTLLAIQIIRECMGKHERDSNFPTLTLRLPEDYQVCDVVKLKIGFGNHQGLLSLYEDTWINHSRLRPSPRTAVLFLELQRKLVCDISETYQTCFRKSLTWQESLKRMNFKAEMSLLSRVHKRAIRTYHISIVGFSQIKSLYLNGKVISHNVTI